MPIEDTIATFAATLLGVGLGIPSALLIDRRLKLREKREGAVNVLSGLREEINHNIDLLGQIQRELNPNTMIYFNMDLNIWRATSLRDFEGTVSHKLLRHIYQIYYEYEHLSRKIDTQFSMHYSVVRTTDIYAGERTTIVAAIINHAAPLEKESGELIGEIDIEIKRLTKKSSHNAENSQNSETNTDWEKRRDRLDHVFEVALVLLGILSAAEFQYFLTLYTLSDSSSVPVTLLYYLLRVNTAPFIVLIVSWLAKELFSDMFRPQVKMLFTEFSWDFLYFALVYYLFVLIGGYQIGITLSLFLTLILITITTWAYVRAYPSTDTSMRRYLINLKWILLRYCVVFALSFALLTVLVYPWEIV